MPDWMRDPEEKIENLNQNLLEEDATPEAGEDDREDSDPLAGLGTWRRTTGAEADEESDAASVEEDSSRMIDLPFGLFDD